MDELAYIAQHGDTTVERSLAETALRNLVRVWKFLPLDFIPVGHGIIEAMEGSLSVANGAEGACFRVCLPVYSTN